ncbi:unnamed protein product, partial [Mesorhabditis spiculigera]
MPPRERTEESPPYFEGDYVPPPPPPPPPLEAFLGIDQLAGSRPGFAACLRYSAETDGENAAARIRYGREAVLVAARPHRFAYQVAVQSLGQFMQPPFIDDGGNIVARFVLVQSRFLLLRRAIHRANPMIAMVGQPALVNYVEEYSLQFNRARGRLIQLIATAGAHRHHPAYLRLQRAGLGWVREIGILRAELQQLVAALFN